MTDPHGRTAQGSRPCSTHHPDEPSGFTDFLDWAEEMSETHDLKRCPHCGKFKVWVPKGIQKTTDESEAAA